MKTGLVHIYCGEGKGKTCAALGLAIRCIGRGKKIFFYQFLKNNTSGECNILKKLDGITFGEGYKNIKFSYSMTQEEKETAKYEYAKHIENIKSLSKLYDMIVLDEAIGAVEKGFISEEDLLEIIDLKGDTTELILTGRYPTDKLIEKADYVSKIQKIKHPFDKGIKAREGIEF